MRVLVLLIVIASIPAAVLAQVAPGSAVAALRTSTKTNSHPDTAPSVVIPPFSPGQIEGCVGENTISVATIKIGALFNLALGDNECNRRRDGWIMAALGDPEAAKERECDSPRVRAAYLRAGNPCKLDR